jgi:hypothetical protein
MQVISREYKVIVDDAIFVDLKHALELILDDIRDAAHLRGSSINGRFDNKDPAERSILFIDTPNQTLRENGLLLRQRVKRKNGKTEYTLKYRTEDQYVAAGTNVKPGKRLKATSKFEEDIGIPFVSRFSHSTTVSINDKSLSGKRFPETLSAAGKIFPVLLQLHRDNLACPPETPLAPVNNLRVFERVFTGPIIEFGNERDGRGSTPAEAAVILWSKRQKDRVLTAEFSFRYKNDNEGFSFEIATAARAFFERLQELNWTRPGALTKTQFMYGTR